MKKFKNFTENLMKVILVPDESSDSISPVQQTVEPQDNFTKTAADYLGHFEQDSDSIENQEIEEEDTDVQSEDEDSCCSVYHDTNGLKISLNGMDFTFTNDVVDKIKSVLMNSEDSESEETEEEIQEDDNSDTEEPNDSYETDNEEENNDDEDKEKITESKKKVEKNNPWAICTSSVGREDKKKYERCVKQVKKKNK
jgi:hypothetical protein